MSTSIYSRPFNKEYTFSTARSSGPGGQHVNKIETKVVLQFHVMDSQLLSDSEKEIISRKLKNKINVEGFLQITVKENSSQIMNKKLAEKRFIETITKALRKKKKRIASKPSKAAIEKRIQKKKIQSEKKARRRLDN